MHRVTNLEKREKMVAAISHLPPPLQGIAWQVDLCTEDPLFVGLESETIEFRFRDRRTTTHDWLHCHAPLLDDGWIGTATVVDPPRNLEPTPFDRYLHELGHAIYFWFNKRIDVGPLWEWWLKGSLSEAFAEWIATMANPNAEPWNRDEALASERNRALWRVLSEGRMDEIERFL